MATLYLTEQNTVLRKSGKRLIVQKEDKILLAVQCHKIDRVLIFGNVQFTTQVVHELCENGIELAIMSRNGRLKGVLALPETKNISLRIQQFQKYSDDEFRLDVAKQIVQGKIRNCLNLIRYHAYNHSDTDVSAETKALDTALNRIALADETNRLLGMEGKAATVYFRAFQKMLRQDMGFAGRKKRPPPDPVNAMLSLGYTMIFNELSSLLEALGFDPFLGYFHKVHYGRASLASDLMEEFRVPAADRLTLALVNNRVFRTTDFYINPMNNGVFFHREAIRRYFAEYEKALNREFVHPERNEKTTLRKCFRIQAEKIAAVIRGNVSYEPFVMSL